MKEHHFFAASAAYWSVGDSIAEAIRGLVGQKNFPLITIARVPGPKTRNYSISQFTPVVAGTVVISEADGGIVDIDAKSRTNPIILKR